MFPVLQEIVMEKTEEIATMPVYSSLLFKPRMFGIGETAFYGIIGFTVVLMSMVHPLCFLFGVILLCVSKILCKNEPFFIDFLVENLGQSDYYIG